MINGEATVLEHMKSNSTTTGISSFASSPLYRLNFIWSLLARQRAALYTTSAQDLVDNFAYRSSEAFLVPFAGVTESKPALQVQKRTSQVVTRVPKSAIWMLVAANMLFMVLALVMAGMAYVASSGDVHQVHTRLSIGGLAAQLFEQPRAQERVSRTDKLFEKHVGDELGRVKAVKIERTDSGGALFATVRSTR